MALQAGQRIGNFQIVRLIGEGGFGEVYLAHNPIIDRRAAVKVLRPSLAGDTDAVWRFLNEARAASAIRHPNIVEVFDAGNTSEGSPYILMEFLEGESLQTRLNDVGRLSVGKALAVANQAGSALAAAHAAGIVHRDLKPENLFLVPDEKEGERVKILDFGIAKVKHVGSRTGTVQTQTGLIMGSPTYMSPEQCKDTADVDLRTDVYSLAVILYEMLTGRPPYVAPSATELLLMHLSERPQPLRELVPEIPASVEEAVLRALARERSDRWDGMPAFLEALAASPGAGQPGAIVHDYVETPSVRRSLQKTIAYPPATTLARASGESVVEPTSSTKELLARISRRGRLVRGGMLFAGAILLLWLLYGGEPPPSKKDGPAHSSEGHVPGGNVAQPGARPAARGRDGGIAADVRPVPVVTGAVPVEVRKPELRPTTATARGTARPTARKPAFSPDAAPSVKPPEDDIAGF
jgi:serine/threonine protein kinase